MSLVGAQRMRTETKQGHGQPVRGGTAGRPDHRRGGLSVSDTKG